MVSLSSEIRSSFCNDCFKTGQICSKVYPRSIRTKESVTYDHLRVYRDMEEKR
jgi:hypothetical protein